MYSGSSAGDLGDVTPCNASPHLSALMPFRQVVRDDAEEIWRQQIQNLIAQAPYNALSFFQLLSKILRVSVVFYKDIIWIVITSKTLKKIFLYC